MDYVEELEQEILEGVHERIALEDKLRHLNESMRANGKRLLRYERRVKKLDVKLVNRQTERKPISHRKIVRYQKTQHTEINLRHERSWLLHERSETRKELNRVVKTIEVKLKEKACLSGAKQSQGT